MPRVRAGGARAPRLGPRVPDRARRGATPRTRSRCSVHDAGARSTRAGRRCAIHAEPDGGAGRTEDAEACARVGRPRLRARLAVRQEGRGRCGAARSWIARVSEASLGGAGGGRARARDRAAALRAPPGRQRRAGRRAVELLPLGPLAARRYIDATIARRRRRSASAGPGASRPPTSRSTSRPRSSAPTGGCCSGCATRSPPTGTRCWSSSTTSRRCSPTRTRRRAAGTCGGWRTSAAREAPIGFRALDTRWRRPLRRRSSATSTPPASPRPCSRTIRRAAGPRPARPVRAPGRRGRRAGRGRHGPRLRRDQRVEGVAIDHEGHAHYVIDEEGHVALRTLLLA